MQFYFRRTVSCYIYDAILWENYEVGSLRKSACVKIGFNFQAPASSEHYDSSLVRTCDALFMNISEIFSRCCNNSSNSIMRYLHSFENCYASLRLLCTSFVLFELYYGSL
jgi:hypothetical protein